MIISFHQYIHKKPSNGSNSADSLADRSDHKHLLQRKDHDPYLLNIPIASRPCRTLLGRVAGRLNNALPVVKLNLTLTLFCLKNDELKR